MLSLYETLAPCKEGKMPIKRPDFFNSFDVIFGVLSRIYRKYRGKKITKFEVQFSDQSEIPGDIEALLTFKIWYKNESEPRIIEHSKLVGGMWQRL